MFAILNRTFEYSGVHGVILFNSSKYKCSECGKCLRTKVHWKNTDKFIRERNRLNVMNVRFVVHDFPMLEIFIGTEGFTVERNRTNVTCVTKCVDNDVAVIYKSIREFVRKKSHTSVMCIKRHLLSLVV